MFGSWLVLAKVITNGHSSMRGTWWHLVSEPRSPLDECVHQWEHKRRTEAEAVGVGIGERFGVLWGTQMDPFVPCEGFLTDRVCKHVYFAGSFREEEVGPRGSWLWDQILCLLICRRVWLFKIKAF